MKLFGITGGIGMGKSTAGNLLLKGGYSLLDTDDVAREIVQPGSECLLEIQNYFGSGILSKSGELNRSALASIVFSDTVSRQKLESILHPRIREVWQAKVQDWREKEIPFGFIIIPLLFETEAAHFFDAVIAIACSRRTQLSRLQSRGWSMEQIQNRIAAQWSVEEKIAASDYVVWTDTSVEIHAAQLRRILAISAA